MTLQNLEVFEITLDLTANNLMISNTKSQVQVWGIPTNEELAIAGEAQAVLGNKQYVCDKQLQ